MNWKNLLLCHQIMNIINVRNVWLMFAHFFGCSAQWGQGLVHFCCLIAKDLVHGFAQDHSIALMWCFQCFICSVSFIFICLCFLIWTDLEPWHLIPNNINAVMDTLCRCIVFVSFWLVTWHFRSCISNEVRTQPFTKAGNHVQGQTFMKLYNIINMGPAGA